MGSLTGILLRLSSCHKHTPTHTHRREKNKLRDSSSLSGAQRSCQKNVSRMFGFPSFQEINHRPTMSFFFQQKKKKELHNVLYQFEPGNIALFLGRKIPQRSHGSWGYVQSRQTPILLRWEPSTFCQTYWQEEKWQTWNSLETLSSYFSSLLFAASFSSRLNFSPGSFIFNVINLSVKKNYLK